MPEIQMLEKLSAIALNLHRGSRDIPMAAFQEWAFELLSTSIDFRAGVWLTGVLHPDQDIATFHTRYLYRLSPQVLIDYNRCNDSTVFSQKVFAAPGSTLACTPSADFGPELAAHARQYRIEQILATALIEPIAGVHELISIYRDDVARPFSEEERTFQQCLVPHLSEAWRACRMQHLADLSQPACTLRARAAGADMLGVLHLIDPGFTSLLRNEWPRWSGPRLPAELMGAYERGELRYVGRRAAFRLFGLDDHILLRGRTKIPLDDLTRREREVAEHYAAGRSHKEIARLLEVAPSTVRNHLTAAYEKLGVDNKAALTAAIREYE